MNAQKCFCGTCRVCRVREERRADPETYRAARRAHYAANAPRLRAAAREAYAQNRESFQAKVALWQKEHAAQVSARARERRERDIEKVRARKQLQYAVFKGTVKRLPCEVCGDPKSEGHHDDYSKPLAVRWLCSLHHGEEHRLAEEVAA